MIMKVEVYSDGSSEGNSTGSAGWAYVIVVDGAKHSEGSGGFGVGTNNIAEIKGASEGLAAVAASKDLCQATEVVLISDSQLVLNFAAGTWRCKKHHLVPYVIALRKAFQQTNATTRWVKGHSGDLYNEQCDNLAKSARIAAKPNSNGQGNQVVNVLPRQAGNKVP